MRITLFFLFFCILFSLASNSYSQEFTIKSKTASIKEVCKEIEKKSDYIFVFSDNSEKVLEKKVNVEANAKDVTEILDVVLSSTGLTYKILDKQIVIFESRDKIPVQASDRITLENITQQPERKQVSGRVVDAEGLSVIGANIVESGTTNGTVTDANGDFSLNVKNDATLRISYIGYLEQNIATSGKSSFNIILQEDTQALDELVVVGYGTQKKENLTGAISAIQSEDIMTTTHSSLGQQIQGKVAGLQIRNQQGEPGEFNSMINIRGFGTPLYVIDGIARDGTYEFQRLNANDIESISILKDASAAVYGLNAANGVILVTTKKGAKGTPKFTYNSYFGIQTPTDMPKVLNAAQFQELTIDAHVNIGLAPPISQEELRKWQDGIPGYESTDWYKEVMKNYTTHTQHNFSVQGGSDIVDYFVSFGFLNDTGLPKSGDIKYQKYDLRSNLTINLTKSLQARILLSGLYDKRDSPSASSLWSFRGTRISLPIERPFANNNPDYPSNITMDSNPIPLADKSYSGYFENVNKNIQTSASLLYKTPFLSGLVFEGTVAYDSNNGLRKDVGKSYNVYSYDPDSDTYVPSKRNSPPFISNDYSDGNRLVMQLRSSYANSFRDKHNINLTAVYEQSKSWGRYAWLMRYYDFFTNDQINQASTNNQQTDGNENESASMSLIGRVNYDYIGKYLLEIAFRHDGSYRYAPHQRWGFFPVISAGWRLSEENFIKNNLDFIDNLKLRASYGKVGENAGRPFQYLLGFSTSGGGGYEFVDGKYTMGAASPGVVNENLTWFNSIIKDIGLDLTLWKGLFGLEFDIYQRDRSGLLARRNLSLPNTFGGTLPEENLNSDRVQGFDFLISHNNKVNDFSYGLSLNFNFGRTKNIYVERSPFNSSYEKWRSDNNNRWSDIMWGYIVENQFQNEEEVMLAPIQNGSLGNTRELPGDFRYRDVDGDGMITGRDQLPIFWTGQPKMHYGLTLKAQYKSFDFNSLLQGSAKYSVRFYEFYGMMFWARANSPAYFYDRWHLSDPYNTNSEWIPGDWPPIRYEPDMGQAYAESNVWRRDASYLRIKSIELGYTLPKKVVKKISLDNARLYISTYNIFTFADQFVKPFDPEKIEGAYSAGFNYPLTKSFNIGANIQF